MENKQFNIGVQHKNAYPEKRNILIFDNANYIEIKDYYLKKINLKNYLRSFSKLKKILGNFIRQSQKERYSFRTFKKHNVDFFHFFNTININAKQSWGVTFETILPTFEPFIDFHKKDFEKGNKLALIGIEKYLKTLSSDYCKFIIPISTCTYKIFESALNYFPKYKVKIIPKIKVLHPPQKILIKKDDLPKNKSLDIVRFLFVGSDLSGKGGVEIINVFKELDKTYKNYHLDVVGKINPNSFYSSNMSKKELEELFSFFNSKQEKITFHEQIENEELLNKIVNDIDVGLLPTRSDTYGYSVLEFQAAGCPVISTDCRALLEINNNDCGWIINVDKNEFKETYHFSKKDLNNIQYQIEAQLKPIIIEILENPSIIYSKSLKALQRIEKEHSFKNFKNELNILYEKSL